MHRAVAEFMVAEHAVTGNDHLELVGLVEVRPSDGARTLLDQEGHRVQRIVGRRLLVWRQGVAIGADTVFQPVDVWRRRVLRARMLSAVRTTAYSVIAVGGGRSGASRCALPHPIPDY